MKKLLYIFLVLPLIFSSCSKDDDDNTPVIPPASVQGCTDADATNYNSAANVDNGSCEYNIADAVWEVITADSSGVNLLDSTVLYLQYFWEEGYYGWEEWDIASSTLLNYAGGPGSGYFTTPGDNILTIGDESGILEEFDVDPMLNNNNMTLRDTGPNGELIVITLENNAFCR